MSFGPTPSNAVLRSSNVHRSKRLRASTLCPLLLILAIFEKARLISQLFSLRADSQWTTSTTFSSTWCTCTASAFILFFAPVKHYDRGLTLVFGSDGQVSLIGFDGGIQTQPPGVSPTLTATNTGALTQGTLPLPRGSTSVAPVPNLDATSAPFASSASLTSTSISPSLTSSSYNPSSTTTTTDTDTNLPSIPTINYPTPTPTAVSDPRDHGVGAPFYLAIVLASISLVGCISALIAWWIRSRTRRRDLEFDDPWDHRKAMSDTGGSFINNENEFAKGAQRHAQAQARPYYLPASIVHSGSSNLLAVPHTISTSEDPTSQNAVPRTILDAGPLRHANPRPQNMDSEPNPFSSETSNLYSRPGTGRLQTGLSVQESTHTLGRLRVANRVPGDVTSGDEGGMNIRNSAGVSPSVNLGGTNSAPAGENAMQENRADQNESIQDGNSLLEPPGPATLSWGRRIDTVAALRRSRRRSPETTVQTYKNPKYGGYLYPTPDGRQSDTTSQASFAVDQRDILAKPLADPLGWTNGFKSSFWQAVDVMTRNRVPDPEQVRAANAGNGSRFTPAPQRITSRRSLTRSTTSSARTDATRTDGSQEMETRSELTPTDNSVVIQETPQNTTYSSPRSSSTRIHEPGTMSHFNRDFGTSTYTRHPSAFKTETGSMYSTESATARANLRRYGYTESIPSSWSALSASRQSQLELSRLFLPLPRPVPSSRLGPPSITPSQPTPEPSLRTGSASVRTHTTMHSESDILGSDASTLRSGTSANTAAHGHSKAATSHASSMLSDGTIQSHSVTVPGTALSQSSSTTSSMLSRKKGVTRRKRPRPPLRAPSTASSIQSVESGLSVREVAVRKALLERRKKVKAVESLKDSGDSLTRSGEAPSAPSRSTNA